MGRTQDAERRGQVAVDNGVPLLVGHLLDDVVPGVAGVVDDDVDATIVLHGGLDETVSEVGSGHTADAGHSLATGVADFCNDVFGRSSVEIIDHDLGAVSGQLQGDATTDTAAGTGDQGDFTFDFFHLFCSRFLLDSSGYAAICQLRSAFNRGRTGS
ncbi:hypothetical protein D9M71_550770 [compost metagenome]